MDDDGAYFIIIFSRSDTSASNYGVFYAKHIDTDSEQERNKKNIDKNHLEELKSADESSDDEWTYTSAKLDRKNSTENHSMDTDTSENDGLNEDKTLVEGTDELRDLSKKVLGDVKLNNVCIQKLVERVDELVQSPKKMTSRKKGSGVAMTSGGNKVKHAERVREWLKKCHANEDYSMVSLHVNYLAII